MLRLSCVSLLCSLVRRVPGSVPPVSPLCSGSVLPLPPYVAVRALMGSSAACRAAVWYRRALQLPWGTAESYGELWLLGPAVPIHGGRILLIKGCLGSGLGPGSSCNRSDQSPVPRNILSFALGSRFWHLELSLSSVTLCPVERERWMLLSCH